VLEIWLTHVSKCFYFYLYHLVESGVTRAAGEKLTGVDVLHGIMIAECCF
jgi:hypothetical protein